MTRRRHWFLGMLILAQLALIHHVAAQSAGTAATAASTNVLAARLGGTRASFAASFGEPIAPGTSDALYDVPAAGLLAVQFQPEPKPGPDDRALVISLRSRRDAALSATSPSPADWSLSTARALARQFLPRDVQIGPETRLDDHDLTATCTSAALARVLTGTCRISYVTPTAATVSFLTVSLGTSGAATPPAAVTDPCTGLPAWAAATSQRINRATTLLTAISTMTSTGSEAVTQLRQDAAQFGDLARAQRQSQPPLATAAVNDALVSIFARYQEALTLSVQAVAQSDAAAGRRAASLIASGNADVTKVQPLLQAALTRCGIAVATPAATP